MIHCIFRPEAECSGHFSKKVRDLSKGDLKKTLLMLPSKLELHQKYHKIPTRSSQKVEICIKYVKSVSCCVVRLVSQVEVNKCFFFPRQ